jgi:hypothetical protein
MKISLNKVIQWVFYRDKQGIFCESLKKNKIRVEAWTGYGEAGYYVEPANRRGITFVVTNEMWDRYREWIKTLDSLTGGDWEEWETEFANGCYPNSTYVGVKFLGGWDNSLRFRFETEKMLGVEIPQIDSKPVVKLTSISDSEAHVVWVDAWCPYEFNQKDVKSSAPKLDKDAILKLVNRVGGVRLRIINERNEKKANDALRRNISRLKSVIRDYTGTRLYGAIRRAGLEQFLLPENRQDLNEAIASVRG